MKWEQVTTVLTLLCGLVSTMCGLVPAIGSMIVAIYTVWFQGAQELKRTELAHRWQEKELEQQRGATVEDRNIGRKWCLTDKQIEERKSYLLAHKRCVDDYIANLLILASRAYMRSVGLEQSISEGTKTSYTQSLEQSAEVYHHIDAFDSAELHQAFQALMETVDKYLTPVLREPEKNRDKVANLRGVVAGATAPVTRIMESLIAEVLQPEDWV